MLVELTPNFIAVAGETPRREDTPSYALRAALALRLAAPRVPLPEVPPAQPAATARPIAA